MIFSSKPGSRFCHLGTSSGSKLPCRSRGTSMPIAPESPSTVFGLKPLRQLAAACTAPSGPATASSSGPRPAAEFWKAHDAHEAAHKK